jgi:catechol 2,3-dioxygenase-like lactoylglutathione lyase family enzyme
MIDHVSLGVTSLEKSRNFYDAVLPPLGLARILDFKSGADYGSMAAPLGVEFTITQETNVTISAGAHICFRAPSRQAVDLFYSEGLKTGGSSGAEPMVREYHEHYYAAFLFDPDGHKIEAVCHLPTHPSIELKEIS